MAPSIVGKEHPVGWVKRSVPTNCLNLVGTSLTLLYPAYIFFESPEIRQFTVYAYVGIVNIFIPTAQKDQNLGLQIQPKGRHLPKAQRLLV